MVPQRGPVRYRVREVATSIAAGSSVGPVAFRFPRPVFVTSVLLLPRSGARADLAALRLRIQDETFQDIISDGIGGHDVSGLELSGLVPLAAPMFSDLVIARPFVVQRPVNTGDRWYITIANGALTAIRPELVIGFAEGVG